MQPQRFWVSATSRATKAKVPILLEAEITKGLGPDAAAELKTLLAEAEKTTSSLAQEAVDPTAELDAVERYQFGLIKNTATEQSTAQDTSVLLLDPASVFEALLDDLQAGVDKALIARRFHEAVVRAHPYGGETVAHSTTQHRHAFRWSFHEPLPDRTCPNRAASCRFHPRPQS